MGIKIRYEGRMTFKVIRPLLVYGSDRKYHVVRRRFGLLLNPRAWWIGVHHSPHNRRFCINLIPCVTFWITQPGGKKP